MFEISEMFESLLSVLVLKSWMVLSMRDSDVETILLIIDWESSKVLANLLSIFSRKCWRLS